ncbi:1-acyl-sn-glycerol-3-phosphate acyltransferase [Hartmannibacter diazotrophicus]|uniref:1-acyl-sn-glycerol-3-phosphate acyltransferase n=1 Tax=Hartmannibacter diazotrophicus TaxID=1482074 RepID=A0A2C9DCC7_9HYPH|nr:lysophospholipid acyltransferase family protein [Hartmannibacter diazotrophicus]SON57893.1 1-acyl-sn-glycerol-3-phosphate acyltransferase [Hartmannibacter diazotrophicus]
MLVRSLLFNALLYPYMIVSMIVCSPAMLLPRGCVVGLAKFWCRTAMALHRVTTGVRHVYTGRENIPQGALLVASKHQSMWETIALMAQFGDAVFVLKRELMWIPLFGWWIRRLDMIPVDRGKGSAALAKMTEATRKTLAQGRQVLIFPEGTRREPGAEPAYKIGIARLYADLGVPCLPVALDSGLVWQRRRMVQRKGTIHVDFLEPIAPGLPMREFFHLLQDRIEARCDERLLEAGQEGVEGLPAAARARIALLKAQAKAD